MTWHVCSNILKKIVDENLIHFTLHHISVFLFLILFFHCYDSFVVKTVVQHYHPKTKNLICFFILIFHIRMHQIIKIALLILGNLNDLLDDECTTC